VILDVFDSGSDVAFTCNRYRLFEHGQCAVAALEARLAGLTG
jgi:hypothetical protein